MKTLPKPNGRYLVGSSTLEVTDTSRPRHVLGQDLGRRLFVKLWYPADPREAPVEPERLWEQLESEPDMPGIAKLLLRPAMKVITNSYTRARYASDIGSPRVLIYSHGMISFASENTMLMEHLANHGYVVVSLQHRDQLAELRTLQKAQKKDEKDEQARLQRKIAAAPIEERAALSKEYFRIASNTNRIVSARAIDIEHVVKELETVLDAVPGVERASSAAVAGVLGLSLGGAVATEFSKQNGAGVGCVINVDGGIYGAQSERPIDRPYLMLYSEQNSGSNDLCLATTDGGAVTKRVIAGTKHLNFHDIAAVYPALRWLGAIGSAAPMSVIDERNQLISSFVSDR